MIFFLLNISILYSIAKKILKFLLWVLKKAVFLQPQIR
jgi:hypothetical protein